MKKVLHFMLLFLFSANFVNAGGLLTNTNQHAAYLRNFARGNSLEVDAAYYNPAGTAFMEDGYYISLNNQSAYQTRTINASRNWDLNANGTNSEKEYGATASVPIVPSIYFVYKKGKYALSALCAVTGGGGTASFDKGLPDLNYGIIKGFGVASVPPNIYNISSSVDGSQFILGTQVGLSYQANDWLSVYIGGRMNNFFGSYEGYVNLTANEGYEAYQPTFSSKNMKLDVTQYGWGLTPIVALDIDWNRWNFMMKYEFKANLNIENKTNENSTQIDAFDDGVNTPSDVPALFSTALGYDILPTLRASAEFHYFDSKNAGMSGNKQDYLTHGTREYLAGLEWDVLPRLTISGSYQLTDYGLSDKFQSQTAFSCDSYAIGFGAKVKISDKAALNIGYMVSDYDDYTKKIDGTNGEKDVYSRTNKVFGFGIDYKF